ncbi:MAG: hypothetical protein CSA26_08650 [Desulfobacterales bacterium]|nr:MAG: hypothetical protein CSA26_08650 [Desulfobacterales bacterium]
MMRKFLGIFTCTAFTVYGAMGFADSSSSQKQAAAKYPETDAVSGASIPRKTGTVSLSGENLISFLGFGGAAYLLSTVNADGTPYVAPINPKLDTDGNLRFVSGLTQSRRNIDRTGKAVLTAYGISCGADDAGTHLGARLMLTAIGEKVSPEKVKSFGLRTVTLRIDQVLPLEEKAAKRPRATYRR